MKIKVLQSCAGLWGTLHCGDEHEVFPGGIDGTCPPEDVVKDLLRAGFVEVVPEVIEEPPAEEPAPKRRRKVSEEE